MPEGAEVRMNRDLLSDTIKSKMLVEVRPVSGKLQRSGIPGLASAVLPSKITDIALKGKQMIIMLESGDGILSTLGMSGWWYPHITRVTEDTKKGRAYMNGQTVEIGSVIDQAYKHTRVELITEEGPTAVFCDMRNFGNMTYLTAAQLQENHPHDKLGFDLLNEPSPFRQGPRWLALKEAASKSRQRKKIGELLLDQEFVCGLGNIYRAETLYAARINPNRTLSELTVEEWTSIGAAANYILHNAYKTQGVMCYNGWFLRDFPGYHVAETHEYKRHLVYGRRADPRGRAIKTETIGGRTMWYCPESQF